jgi:hypothetical protein
VTVRQCEMWVRTDNTSLLFFKFLLAKNVCRLRNIPEKVHAQSTTNRQSSTDLEVLLNRLMISRTVKCHMLALKQVPHNLASHRRTISYVQSILFFNLCTKCVTELTPLGCVEFRVHTLFVLCFVVFLSCNLVFYLIVFIVITTINHQ